MKYSSRRTVLKGLAVTAPLSWARPVVESTILPAHAMTSCVPADSIRVLSPASNSAERFALIVDAQDNVLARCCCGSDGPQGYIDIIIQADSLPPGTYRVLGDSEGSLSHTMVVTTGCNAQEVTATTDDGNCVFLMATVTLPSGSITPQSGQSVGGGFCGDPVNCLEGAGFIP